MNSVVGGDSFSPDKIREFHRKLISSIGIPDWIIETKCFKCGKELGELSIRGISLKTNAARIGDLAVEVACASCSFGYEFYYRNAYKDLDSFLSVLKSKTAPSSPISSMDLSQDDNNLLKKLINLENREK